MKYNIFIFDILFSGLLALAGVAMGQYFARKSSVEVDIWRKREETYRMLRYGIDLTHKESNETKEDRVTVLTALSKSTILQDSDIKLVNEISRKIFKRIK